MTAPRIPYKPHDDAGPPEVVEPIRARRGGTLLNLDRQLLHSPPLALGWNALLRAVRTQLTLPDKLRELAICAVATLNDAEYEFHHHAPVLLQAGGTEAQVDALRDIDAALQREDLFDAAERAVLRLTLESTRQVAVSDATFHAARAALPNDQQAVELVAVIAAYNMVSRVIVTLGIGPE